MGVLYSIDHMMLLYLRERMPPLHSWGIWFCAAVSISISSNHTRIHTTSDVAELNRISRNNDRVIVCQPSIVNDATLCTLQLIDPFDKIRIRASENHFKYNYP
jgi:hypothetical protein